MNAGRTIWTNTDERVFLDGLGKWGERKRDRKKLLENYLNASMLRKRWGNIYHVGVKAYVKRLIRTEGDGRED